ncbi:MULTISPECIES: DUF6787 family protein [Croceibacter]|jgi:hypothetical protein|uniref:DUF6787 domain-containing protein n=1 Tax=Croceibacter atlanticus (strain ATCC BAA-628 / JCM 21780 / CIP 108009 / IAM 15332 / KCTC 12090 / HTCC2559) TaxID=216432 RepID=A3UBU0_CROAH|nr:MULTISPECIES: DUF6787 family protein [Croceibacter]HAT69908.1 diacylglyceryl transferase [Flavobacteriaceae bacterium]EAP86091.1 hypothetical protein CA2559_08661 [Croceibacter atlanticus HTCC2559]MAM22631.1 diacylglyceryl transferase [Croceibacter sp.]MBG24689.1 diacylglyceryl transferase [Croceibacter sp.]WSP33768.1 DUF6787 family protein [Croceibacter atlanticus]|tara:strand:+ start:924 stop:1226 length:303 start_codon:yes stop_codon:yes gene_type:complete
MKKLKERWGISSNWQVVVIFIVFGITGSTSAKIAGPIVEFLGITQENTSGWIYWPVRILLIFPVYQVLLIIFGWIFGQFQFFWAFEKKMLRRLGFAKFLD